MMINVSIVVPVYNVELYLERCVNSILGQTYSDFQLILVDDGSPDECPKLCDLYESKDHRIKVIHRENGGLSAARNTGIDWVVKNNPTEWITFIDSDDWIHPQYLEVLLNASEKAQVDVAVASFDIVNKYSCDYRSLTTDNFRVLQTEDFFVDNEYHPISACGRLFRTFLFENIRFPEGRIHEDRFTTYKLLFKRDKIVYADDGLYFCFENPDSITRISWSPKRLDDIIAIEQQLKYFKKSVYRKLYLFLLNEYAALLLYSLKKASRSKKYPFMVLKLKFKLIRLNLLHKKKLTLTDKQKKESFKYIFPILYRVHNRLVK